MIVVAATKHSTNLGFFVAILFRLVPIVIIGSVFI